MKTLLRLLCLAFALVAIGAADPTPVVTLSYLGSNPTFDADGNLVSAPVQAGFTSAIMADDQKFSAQQNVSWDGADKEKTVTLGKTTLTYYEVTSFVAAIANQERTSQSANAKAAKAASALATP